MRHVTKIVNKLVTPIAQKRGMVSGKIILDWDIIVGKTYAGWCKPEKVVFRPGQRVNGVLYLHINPSHALLVQHSHDMLLEKINTYFGYKAVSKVILKQVPFEKTPLQNISQKKGKLIKHSTAENRIERALENLKALIEQDKKQK